MTPADIPGGLRLCRASGWNQVEEDWRIFLESPGSGVVLIERAGAVLATAAYMRYDVLAWIAMMLVDPEERRNGLGSRLLAEAVSRVADVPCIGLDATPLGESLYRRFGFEEDYRLMRCSATADGTRFPEGSRAARPMLAGDLPAVYRHDREVFGADRSHLLAWSYRRAPDCAWIVAGEGGLEGYTFGRQGFLYSQLGPIVARDTATAQDLVAACMGRAEGRKFVIDAPVRHTAWLEFLESAGFAGERRLARMFLRGHKHPGNPAMQFGITAPAFG